jgi:hypothetical protein
MCTIVAKKFPGIGWIGVKNRDRPAATDTDLIRDVHANVHRITLIDENTKWSEGMNNQGVSIISSSLTPVIHSSGKHLSKDGKKLGHALAERTVEDAVQKLVEMHITGCVMVFDKNDLWLIEGKTGDHKIAARKITDDQVARTNHGVWLPEAGYQPNNQSTIMRMRRISSEARLLIAENILKQAKSPNEIMVLLAKEWSDNPQLTTLRKPTDIIETRTTEQLMLEPGKKMMFIRNTDGKLEFDQKSANPPGSKILVGIVQE